MPDNLDSFINDAIIPSFKDQRSSDYQFAVLLLLSDEDFRNITDMTFHPSNRSGRPILDNTYTSMPQGTSSYGNYIVARPDRNHRHSEEVIFGLHSTNNTPFEKLWGAYVDSHNNAPPKYILLYSWNQPCSRCTEAIIRALEESPYHRTKAIVVHTRYWQLSEDEQESRKNREKLISRNIAVKQVVCPRPVPPAGSICSYSWLSSSVNNVTL